VGADNHSRGTGRRNAASGDSAGSCGRCSKKRTCPYSVSRKLYYTSVCAPPDLVRTEPVDLVMGRLAAPGGRDNCD
jgi:hypothetical protein